MDELAENKGVITDIQRFSVHDGTGIRTTVFLKGCPLRCLWCHNPETQNPFPEPLYTAMRCVGCGACAELCPCHTVSASGHGFDSGTCTRCLRCTEVCPVSALAICGRETTARAVLDIVLRDAAFYCPGGLTVSGGEPMFQPAFALALLRGAAARGVQTCVQTCGYFGAEWIEPLCAACDRIYWDIKDTDPVRHKHNTGGDLAVILRNLAAAARLKPGGITVRTLMIAGVNDDQAHRDAVARLAGENGLAGVETLTYHPFGGSKRRALGRTQTIV